MLPITAKLSKTLQSKQLDISMISALVDASITSIDDAIKPSAIWILEVLDNKDDIQQITGETIDTIKLLRFQETLSIFDPRKSQVLTQLNCQHMEQSSLNYSLITMHKIDTV